jgi:hypothetical protein
MRSLKIKAALYVLYYKDVLIHKQRCLSAFHEIIAENDVPIIIAFYAGVNTFKPWQMKPKATGIIIRSLTAHQWSILRQIYRGLFDCLLSSEQLLNQLFEWLELAQLCSSSPYNG